jgi:hypothetical protein
MCQGLLVASKGKEGKKGIESRKAEKRMWDKRED